MKYQKKKELDWHMILNYEARNFEFSIVKGNEIHRLDFQPLEEGEFRVTKYIDTFPFFPRMFRFFHNTAPYFPYIAKMSHSKLGTINFKENDDSLKKAITNYIEKSLITR